MTHCLGKKFFWRRNTSFVQRESIFVDTKISGGQDQGRIQHMSRHSDRLTSFLHKICNENQYCVVTKLCTNKINE